MQNELKCFQETNFEHNHLYHKWEADQIKVSCKNHNQEKEWATSLYFLIMTMQKSRLMSNLRILIRKSAGQLLLERLPKQKTNYGRERLGGGPLCWSCYWSFQPTIEINEQRLAQMHSATKKKLTKLNPALLLTVQSLETFSVKHIADKHQVPSTSPHSAIIRNIFSEAHCRQTPGSHWRL